jgi:predicted nucleotidyltransferase
MKIFTDIPLRKKDYNAIGEAVTLLTAQFPIEHVILFGSKARGDDDEYSDIDLLLVTSQKIHWEEEKAIVDLLFDVGMKYDVIFTPLDVTMKDWDGGIFTILPIYKEILQDGVIVL